MKNILLTLLLSLVTCSAQITNVFTGTTPNDHSGDTLYNAFKKLNWNDTYFAGMVGSNTTAINASSNYFKLLIGTNNNGLLLTSNNLIVVSNICALIQTNANIMSNNFVAVSNTVHDLPGGYIQTASVNSNTLDSATMTWLQSLLPSGAHMNFDGGSITSDGAGAMTAVSIKGNLIDGANNPATAGYYPKGETGGSWTWTAWPTEMAFDSGTIHSDGSGNITALSLQSELMDAAYSTGVIYQVPIATGTGTYNWGQITGDSVQSGTVNSNVLDSATMSWLNSAYEVVPDTAGNGGTCVHVKASDNGADMYIHVNSSGVITATGSP